MARCTSRWLNPIPAAAPPSSSAKIPAATASPRAGKGSARSASAAAAASSQRWPSTAAASTSCRAAGLSAPTRASTTPASDRGTRTAPPPKPRPAAPASSSTARQYNGLPLVSSSSRLTAGRGRSRTPSARPSATTSSGARPPSRTRPAR